MPMRSQALPILWRINVWSFLILLVLASTGLLQWLLPHGPSGTAALRHLLRWVHEAAAVVFLLLIGGHLWQHGEYIRRHIARYGFFGHQTPEAKSRDGQP